MPAGVRSQMLVWRWSRTRAVGSGYGTVDICPACSRRFGSIDEIRRGQEQTQPFFTSACKAVPGRQFRRDNARREKCGQNNSKTVVPVLVVRVVPVTGRTAHVPVIVVERAATQHAAPMSLPPQDRPQPVVAREKFQPCYWFCLRQPPNSRPISATISATWRYWPLLSHCQRQARRR